MAETITVTISEEVKQAIDDVARGQGVTADEVVAHAIKEYLFVRQLRSLRERMVANARSQDIFNDEDVFNRCKRSDSGVGQ